MTDHLPECYQSEGKFDAMCVCDRLRVCEQRVLAAAREAVAAGPHACPFCRRKHPALSNA